MGDGSITENIYSGSLVSLRVETLPQPDGGARRFEIVEHPDTVAIVAVRAATGEDNGDGEPAVALVRQQRPAVGQATWEIPAGLVRPDERGDLERAARRELFEETGYVAGALHLLTREYPSPGFSTEAISIYLATDVRPLPGQDGPVDRAEIPELQWLPFGAAQERALDGGMEDGKTLLGLLLAQAVLAPTTSTARGDAVPRDITTMPFARRTVPYREAEGATGGDDAGLKLESILLEEFNYASVTAYQAMEDRARMFNLYLIVIGIFGSAFGALFQIAGTQAQPLAIMALIIAWVAGISFFGQLIRLRQAFLGSLRAMNEIKEYYLARFPEAKPAFLWTKGTMPRGEHTGTVTYLVCHTVAFLGSLCFAGAAFFADEVLIAHVPSAALSVVSPYQSALAAVVLGLASYIGHSIYFQRTLNSDKAKRK